MPRLPPVTRTVRGAVMLGYDLRASAGSDQRSTADAQVIPAPKPTSRTRSPSRDAVRGRARRRGRAGSTPPTCCRWHGAPARSGRAGMPSLSQAESMMRMLAWWGTTRAMSSAGDAGTFHGAWSADCDHDPDGTPEHLRARPSACSRRPRRRGCARAAVGADVPAEQLRWFAVGHGVDDDCAATVAEEDGGVAVVGIGHAVEGLGADEQDALGAHGDVAVGRGQAVDEPGAGGVEVERAAVEPEQLLRRVEADAGSDRSGLVVHRMRRSIVAGSTPACSIAFRPASAASPAVVPPVRRSLMPVRSVIHSSVVSSRASRSALVSTPSGSAVPQPMIRPLRGAGHDDPPRRWRRRRPVRGSWRRDGRWTVSMRLIVPVRTVPARTSTKVVGTEVDQGLATDAAHRTGLISWRSRRSGQSAADGVDRGVDVGHDREIGVVEVRARRWPRRVPRRPAP